MPETSLPKGLSDMQNAVVETISLFNPLVPRRLAVYNSAEQVVQEYFGRLTLVCLLGEGVSKGRMLVQ